MTEEKLDLKALSLKGMRDFLPQEKRKRDKTVQTLRETFELYGFEPLETPATERLEVLSNKFAGGEEILKEIYTFCDQGKRKLGLRYDLTVPLCRVIAENPRLPMPFKRYQIAPVWRDGPTKTGRYREFTQCDFDIIGAKETADVEILLLTLKAFEKLGLDVIIRLNNRKLLTGIMDDCKISSDKQPTAMLSLDKLLKIGKAGVEKELLEKGSSKEATTKFLEKTSDKTRLNDLEISSEEGKEGLRELKELFTLLPKTSKIVFDASLSRGLNYYTGMVFEAYLADQSKVSSSLAAGGRYDNLIGAFLGSKEQVPATGGSFGLDVITEALNETTQESNTQVFVIPIKDVKEGLKIAEEFRKQGISASCDLNGKKLGKNLEYAAKISVPFAAIIGEKELKENKVTLRDMKTGKQEELSVKDAVKKIL